MPAKSQKYPLPRYLTVTATAYKYQRRVPTLLVDRVGCKTWDVYLGSDLPNALKRHAALVSDHDALIMLLENPEAQAALRDNARGEAHAANLSAAVADAPEIFAASWRDTEEYLTGSKGLSRRRERETLATFALQAFGDRTHIDQIEDPSPVLLASTEMPVADMPTKGVELAMWTAMKSALTERLSELSPKKKTTPITTRMEEYIAYRSVADATARNYRLRIARFIKFAGRDLPLEAISAPLLREYRNHLMNGDEATGPVSRSVVRQYFYPLKSLFRWALREDLVEVDPTTKIDLPDPTKTVEETKWQSFNPDEIALVWRAVSQEWGVDGRHQLPSARRQAFLMAFRVLLWTGMRPNEVFKLMPEQVEADRIHIKKTKTGAARVIPLAAPIGDFHHAIRTDAWREVAALGNPAGKMSGSFTAIIRGAGLTNSRHVLYSLKDTLVDRLEALGASENIQRTIIGHTTGRGALRHYKTAATVAQMREHLDAVYYCPGLGRSDCIDAPPLSSR
jgi:site-specific recombinase XerD